MADVPISGLTDATTVNGTDEIPIVQSGVTKRATVTELAVAIVPQDASTSAKGIIEIATNAEAAAGSYTSLAMTPSNTRHAAANGGFQKVVLDGATGSSSDGDMNITGSYLVNGTALPFVQTATPVSFSAVASVVITVDFTTYSAYRLDVYISAGSSANLTIEASSNGGVGYATSSYNQTRVAGTTVSNQTNNFVSYGGSDIAFSVLHISQPSTSSNTMAATTSAVEATHTQTGTVKMATTGATNRLRLAISGTFTGYYILTPIAKR